jgi:hypothetical protein
MAHAGCPELPGHGIAAVAGAPGGMTSRYGVAPGGNPADNSGGAGLAVADSPGEVGLGVDGSSDTARSTIETVGALYPCRARGRSPVDSPNTSRTREAAGRLKAVAGEALRIARRIDDRVAQYILLDLDEPSCRT